MRGNMWPKLKKFHPKYHFCVQRPFIEYHSLEPKTQMKKVKRTVVANFRNSLKNFLIKPVEQISTVCHK